VLQYLEPIKWDRYRQAIASSSICFLFYIRIAACHHPFVNLFPALLILDQQDPYVGVLYGGIAMIDTASISLLDAGHRKIYAALWYIE